LYAQTSSVKKPGLHALYTPVCS